jgi:hypothetical protein
MSSVSPANFGIVIPEQAVWSPFRDAFAAFDYPFLILAQANFSAPNITANRNVFVGARLRAAVLGGV